MSSTPDPGEASHGAGRVERRALAARWVLPMTSGTDTEDFVLDAHAVLLRGEAIEAVLPRDDLPPDVPVTDLGERLLMPGLVNGHGHLAMTLLRGFADDMPLEPWLTERIWPLEARWVDAHFVTEGSELASLEMLLGGVTTYSDMYFFPEAGADVARRSGLRAQILAPLIEFPNAWASGPEAGIEQTLALREACAGESRLRIGFGPHSTYTLSPPQLARIAELAVETGAPVQIHLHETAQEIAEGRRDHGARPIDLLRETGLLAAGLQTVHMTQLEAGDPAELAERGVSVVHCPQSNLKLASGLCPVSALRDAGVAVGLGTDGAASNNALSMFREMHVAALVGKIQRADAAALPAADVLRMATIDGARALGLDAVTGSLAPGKAADVIAVDLSAPGCQPLYNPASQLVYTGTEARVTHVWVDGELLLDDGEPTRLDRDRILQDAAAWRARIQAA